MYRYFRLQFACFFILSGLVFSLFCALPRASAEPQPQQAIETFLDKIKAMEFPITDTVKHKQLVSEANAFLDLEAMGKQALSNHWEQTAEGDRKAFLELLWDLIENVAYSRSRKFMGDYKITYPDVKEVPDGFQVHSVIKQEEEGLDAKVDYHIYQKDGQWKIDDIVLDEVSITEDLKYQFDKIIQDSGFEGLLNKMRDRLAQAEKENLPAQ